MNHPAGLQKPATFLTLDDGGQNPLRADTGHAAARSDFDPCTICWGTAARRARWKEAEVCGYSFQAVSVLLKLSRDKLCENGLMAVHVDDAPRLPTLF